MIIDFFSHFFILIFGLLLFFSLFWLSCAYRWPILWHSKQTVSQAIGLPAGIQIEIRIQGQTNLLITRSAQSSRAVCRGNKQTSRKVSEVRNTIRGAISNDPINAVCRRKLDENIQQLVTNSFNQDEFKAIAKHLFELGLQQFRSY